MSDTYVVTGTGAETKYTILKDPDAILDYTFDWSDWLEDISDTMVDHQIIVDEGLTCDSSSTVGNSVVAWLSGGQTGTTYRATCRIITAGGRTDDRSIFLKVKER
jgi:hypothetical protein